MGVTDRNILLFLAQIEEQIDYIVQARAAPSVPLFASIRDLLKASIFAFCGRLLHRVYVSGRHPQCLLLVGPHRREPIRSSIFVNSMGSVDIPSPVEKTRHPSPYPVSAPRPITRPRPLPLPSSAARIVAYTLAPPRAL